MKGGNSKSAKCWELSSINEEQKFSDLEYSEFQGEWIKRKKKTITAGHTEYHRQR